MKKIALITTHPIQYQLPLFKNFKKYKIKADVYFASSHGYLSKNKDKEFQVKFNWDLYKKPLDGFTSYFSKNQKNSIFDFRLSFKNLEKKIIQNNYDAILIFGWNNIFYLKSLYLGKKLGIKTILRVETNLQSKMFFLKKYIKYKILRNFLKLFDSFLYIGSLNKLFYIKHSVPKHKLYYAPYFIDNEFFFYKNLDKKFIKKKLNLDNKKNILFVGKLIDRKSPHDFLNLALKFRQYRQLHFTIVGSGYLKNYCKQFINRNKLSNVTLRGFQNQKKLREIYKVSDLLVLPSKYETWGLVINEAMACGVPVIASKECGASIDLIKNGITGYTYESGNLNQLYSKFRKVILNTKNHNIMRSNALKKIKGFTYDKTIESVIKILKKKR